MIPFDLLNQPLESGRFLIEASAGTGKTFNIQHLYLRLILERNCSVKEILVVTYTESATAELRGRIRTNLRMALDCLSEESAGDPVLTALLKQAGNKISLEEIKNRLNEALVSFDEAAVFTIHGFCKRMLNEYAFDSGVAFDTEFVESQDEIVGEVVRDFWRRKRMELSSEEVDSLFNGKHKNPIPHWLPFALKITDNPKIHLFPPLSDDGLYARLTYELYCELTTLSPVRKRKLQLGKQAFSDMIWDLYTALESQGGSTSPMAHQIRRKFKAVMVDEFQDTDPIQYSIFNAVFGVSGRLFLMIGDPKQSIYGFRGADIHTYLKAKSEVEQIFTLTQNFRSAPALLRAFESFFGRSDPFVEAGIDYTPVTSGLGEHYPIRFLLKGTEAPAFQLHWLTTPEAEPMGKGEAAACLPSALTAEILHILQYGTFESESGSRPVLPGDIAILAVSHADATSYRAALRAAGIPSVAAKSGNVFLSETAADLLAVLRAVCEPDSRPLLRAALCSRLMGFSEAWLLEADQWVDSDPAADWIATFHDLRRRWEQWGVMPCFSAFIHDRSLFQDGICILDRLAADALTGERRITDLRHLMTLLHQTSLSLSPTPEQLVAWFFGKVCNAETDRDKTCEMRLDTDRDAVTVMTVHASKGLEFPIVLCPALWARGVERMGGLWSCHDGEQIVLPLTASDQERYLPQGKREALSEALRLTYVALTRARVVCHVWGGNLMDGNLKNAKDPINYLLGRGEDGFYSPEIFLSKAKTLPGNEAPLLPYITTPLPAEPEGLYRPQITENVLIPQRLPSGFNVPRYWGIMSYTGLGYAGNHVVCSDDEKVENNRAETSSPVTGGVCSPFAAFPKGRHAGICIHEIFESINYEGVSIDSADASVIEKTEEILHAYGFCSEFDRTHLLEVLPMLQAALASPLVPESGASFTLNDPKVRKIAEMPFLYPVPKAIDFKGVERLCGLSVDPFKMVLNQGMMIGSIDLVIRNGTRYYFLDWKTDILGEGSLDAYTPSALNSVMVPNHYRLQYYLYSLALHRYLQARLPGYDFDIHFGGGFYLFLRGISAERIDTGRYFSKITREELETLIHILGQKEEG